MTKLAVTEPVTRDRTPNTRRNLFDGYGAIGTDRQTRTSHYGIGENGEIRAYVDEANTAWHAGNWNANISSVGIEHCNSTGSPNWGINQATIDANAKLCADIAKRYGLGKLVVNKNIFPHSYFSATSCPGQLLGKLQEIADKANAINNGSSTPSA
ncbi:N-acetylmuramoyl-L-alanine amidase, partial [Bifidobacterium mongoliense]|uniref:peptidoglycan recognition protein family protein n=1 Tax=Bifidobacterium mongoliense TaxID=518643 RepID=UPI002A75B842